MWAGIFNVAIGIVCVVAALGGGYALIGTDSQEALAAVGGVIAAIGIFQLVRHARREP
jgi:hypothetical protein